MRHGRNRVAVVILPQRFPKVARASQPWAGGRNPFGIGRARTRFDLIRPIPSQIKALPFEAAKGSGRQLAICSRNLAYTTAGDMAATRVGHGTLDQHVNTQDDNQ
jgi:hypothetical protein